jgi:hypothetical protein
MKTVLLLMFLSGLAAAQGVWAGAAWAAPDIVTLRCTLRNSVPRSGGTVPDRPFSWRFKVDFRHQTVDGRPATFTSTQIQWQGAQMPALPYATLFLPDWRFHSARQIGHVWNEVTGTCVPR